MYIYFDENSKVFFLHTEKTTYIVGLADGKYPGHVYYGNRISEDTVDAQAVGAALRTDERPFSPDMMPGEKVSFFDCFPAEFPCGGVGDYRESAVEIRSAQGFTGCEFIYKEHRIYDGKPSPAGLPATFAEAGRCQTLEISLVDEVLDAELLLSYTLFDDSDAIIRSAKVENKGNEPIYIEKLFSASMDIDEGEMEMITLTGSWARERHIDRYPIHQGRQSVSSTRGITGHQSQPFLALVEPTTTQTQGSVYAMNLIYSGNFKAQAELDQFGKARMSIGISEERFTWKLGSGESFESPEAVLVYSGEGLGEMTRTFHDLYRSHLIRSPYLHTPRPVLINNWEATYFDFDEEKLVDIARVAKDCGLDMLVMDDGWFGHRVMENSSLGDWKVYEKRLPNGLKHLVDRVNEIGLKFGIWFEPEMISPDSDLYREHPDFALQIPGREPGQARNQYVLDMSRQEVVDCIFEQMVDVLTSANIEYVKWDMNRPLADLGSTEYTGDRAGEIAHRYLLGVYQLQERLLQKFPKLLLENCAGGGSRFDPGMLYYSPQIWCSDDTDALERLYIQEGTAMIYPLSTIGSHVSVCPNHIVGRTTPWSMRADVALSGTFGYELDITKLSEDERALVRDQVETYRRHSELIREGDYYRIASVSENHIYDCYQVVSKDKSESLMVYIQAKAEPNIHSRRVRMAGLDESASYSVHICIDADQQEKEKEGKEVTERIYGGGMLMNMGIYMPSMMGDGSAVRVHLKKV